MSRNCCHPASSTLCPETRPQPCVPKSSWVKTRWAGCWARPLYNQNPANGHITHQYMCAPWCGATCWCPVGVHSLVSHWLVSILNNMHGVSPPMSSSPTTAVPAFHLTPPTTHISFPSRAPLQHPPSPFSYHLEILLISFEISINLYMNFSWALKLISVTSYHIP